MTIRVGWELDKKTSSRVVKGFDPITGEVMVEGIYIKRHVWKNAIPTVAIKFHAVMDNFYPVGSNEATLLEKVLDPTNKLILAGNDSKVLVSDSDGETLIFYLQYSYT